jgi:hypothetical protein
MKSVLPFRGDDTLMYSITYDLATPESRELGSFEESGYIVEPTEGELQDILLQANRDYGIYMPVGVGSFTNPRADEDNDYFTKGHDKYYTLFINKTDGSRLNQEELDFITALLNEGKYSYDEESNRFYEWGGTPEYGIGGWIGGTLIGGFLGYQVGKAVGYGRAVQGYEGGGDIPEGYHQMPDGTIMPDSAHYGLGGLLLAGGFGAYVGYKIGRAKPKKTGFGTEKKIARKVKSKAKELTSKKKFADGGNLYSHQIGKYVRAYYNETLSNDDNGYQVNLMFYNNQDDDDYFDEEFITTNSPEEAEILADKINEEGYEKFMPKKKFADGGKVLASSSSKEGINKLIEQYLYGSTITLVQTDNDKIYEVHNKKGKTSFYVELSRGKYKFIQPSMYDNGGEITTGYLHKKYGVDKDEVMQHYDFYVEQEEDNDNEPLSFDLWLQEYGEDTAIMLSDIEARKNKMANGGETITKPKPRITPTETPTKPDKGNPYAPKVKPFPKADYLISNK